MQALAENKNKSRLGWLDIGKAAGIFVVLMVHAGMRLGKITFYGGMFYMPIFFVAAGYTWRRKEQESYGVFLKKKAQRLLVPYISVSLFLWLFFWAKDSLLGGNPSDLLLHSVFGIVYSRNQMFTNDASVLMDLKNSPLWFLTAMFLTYAYYEAISRSRRKYIFLAAGLLCAVIWHRISFLLLPWSLDAVPYFACFFAAGELLREGRIPVWDGKKWYIPLLTAVIFVLASECNGTVNLSVGNYGRSMLLNLVAGTAGSCLVFDAAMFIEKKAAPLSKVLCAVGQQTLVILCFHMFLFMFLQTAGQIIGLSGLPLGSLTVLGSVILLTLAGKCKERFLDHGRRF